MSSRRDTTVDFGILLHLAFARFKDDLHAHMAKDGFDDLGTSFGFVFRALEAAPLNLRGLAERLGISPQGALKIVDEMVTKKYIRRLADPDDGRATLLALAPRGEKALSSAHHFHRRFEAALAEQLGVRRVADARAVLTAMAEAKQASASQSAVRPF